jgi:hypothetical protein
MKYATIDSLRQQYPISMLCELLEASRSGYHEGRFCPRTIRMERVMCSTGTSAVVLLFGIGPALGALPFQILIWPAHPDRQVLALEYRPRASQAVLSSLHSEPHCAVRKPRPPGVEFQTIQPRWKTHVRKSVLAARPRGFDHGRLARHR